MQTSFGVEGASQTTPAGPNTAVHHAWHIHTHTHTHTHHSFQGFGVEMRF